jgi:hypothetical protein
MVLVRAVLIGLEIGFLQIFFPGNGYKEAAECNKAESL